MLLWIVIIFLALAGGIATFTCLTALAGNLWFKEFTSLTRQTGLSAPVLFVRTLASAFLGSGFALITSLLCPGRGLHRPVQVSPEQRPVLCIHGLYHNRCAWFFYRRWLRTDPDLALYTWSYSSFGRDFSSLATELSSVLHQVARDHPHQGMILLGHSLGGLLLRTALSDPLLGQQTALAVTLATPHQGTILAHLALGRLARSLGYQGPLVTSPRPNACPPETRRVSFFPPLDNLVVPASGLRVQDTGWEEITTPPLGHVSFLFHPPVARHLLRLIQEIKTS